MLAEARSVYMSRRTRRVLVLAFFVLLRPGGASATPAFDQMRWGLVASVESTDDGTTVFASSLPSSFDDSVSVIADGTSAQASMTGEVSPDLSGTVGGAVGGDWETRNRALSASVASFFITFDTVGSGSFFLDVLGTADLDGGGRFDIDIYRIGGGSREYEDNFILTTDGVSSFSERFVFLADERYEFHASLGQGDVGRTVSSSFDMSFAFVPVPEPASGALLFLGCICLAAARRHHRTRG